MKWQKALTKKQLKHLRWTVNGDTPTLYRFRILRKAQAKMEADELARSGNRIFACHDCNSIEYRLKEAGKLQPNKDEGNEHQS